MNPFMIVKPDTHPRHSTVREILCSEGLASWREMLADSAQFEAACPDCAIVLPGEYDRDFLHTLVDYVKQGGRLLLMAPDVRTGEAFGVLRGRPMVNSYIRVHSVPYFIECEEDLLCPAHTGFALKGKGTCCADLIDATGDYAGAAILHKIFGHGKALIMGIDLPEINVILRHGWADYDAPKGAAYRGPRSIWAYKGLEALYSKQNPIGDLHNDLFRLLIEMLTEDMEGVRPRFWHFPHAAKSLFMLKADGCGEKGVDKMAELADHFDAKMTFYRSADSRYSIDFVKDMIKRGHAVAPEFDITSVTHKITYKTMNEDHIRRVQSMMEQHARDLQTQCDIDFQTICIHGCQWLGRAHVELILENRWKMITSFISFYPGMQKPGYGIYAIASHMPMRYLDRTYGPCDIIHAPAAWDESQSLGGPDERHAGLTQQEYVDMFTRFLRLSIEQNHLPHVANFHPIYAFKRGFDFYSNDALKGFLSVCKAHSVPCINLESWCAFTDARLSLEVERLRILPQTTSFDLVCKKRIEGLTMFLENKKGHCTVLLDGKEQTVCKASFEKRTRYYVIFDQLEPKKAHITIRSQ